MKKFSTFGAWMIALTVGAMTASPAHADAKRDAWRDCMALCALSAFWPPGVAAWAAGCTTGYAVHSASRGNGTAPRFDHNAGYAPGTEVLLYNPGETLTLTAGVWEAASDTFIDPSGVASVEFSVIDFFDLFAAPDVDSAPWVVLGSGTPNGTMWELPWTPSVLPAYGWAIRADFFDGERGASTALNAAGVIPSPAGALLLGVGMLGFRRRR